MKLAVARTLQILECSPIILHEQPNKGRTIIEKFSNYSDVSFAVVILSPDDKGFLNDDSPVNAHHRARQNVIFELGYFIGKLGRERVFPLYLNPPKGNLELPSDYSGVVYTEYDSNGNWRYALVKELRTCGIAVDANKL
jgi:predicted nucleotide-binding protein